MGAGAEFQARVAAWAAAHALAETDSQPPFDLGSPIASVGCEGTEPVDDLVLRTIAGHTGYVQAKTRLPLSGKRRNADGRLLPLASAIDQFVRQFLARAQESKAGAEQGLEEAHDRLVLAVSSRAPSSIRKTLKGVLDRLRLQPKDLPLQGSTLNNDEKGALEIASHLSRASWREVTGDVATDQQIHDFLRFVRVQTIEVEADESAEQAVKQLLRTSVLEEPNQVAQAWLLLVNIGHRLISTRSTTSRAALTTEFISAGIRVRTPRGYREDVERLRRHSAMIAERLADNSSISLGGTRVEIARPYVNEIRGLTEDGNLLVVGEPGAGKSGAMHALTHVLNSEGRDVVLLTAQDPPFASLGELRQELQLDHEITDVLANWAGPQPAFLLVDALDAARTDVTARALRNLMSEVTKHARRWRVIASIREYDLRYGRDVKQLFRGASASVNRLLGRDFDQVRHVVVGRLTEAELEQLGESAPGLHELVRSAPPALRELLRNPFNLRLASELLESGTSPHEIGQLQAQVELLDLYWNTRVLQAGETREQGAREAVVRSAVGIMVKERSLRIDRDQIDDPAASTALADLLSAHILVEWSSGAGRPSRGGGLTLSHHVLFDYAVARLLLRRHTKRLVEFLVSDPTFVLLARPSLEIHYHYLWTFDSPESPKALFWECVLTVAGEPAIPEIGKLVGPGVAAQMVTQFEEFAPLIIALVATNESVRTDAENAFNHLVRSVLGTTDSPRSRPTLWSTLLEHVSRSLHDGTAYGVRALLAVFTERLDEFDHIDQGRIGQTGRRLLEYAWRRAPRDRGLVIHSVQYVAKTFGTDPVASGALFRRAIEPAHLAMHGSEELLWIAQAARAFVSADPTLVRDIYVAAFSYRETSNAPTPMGGIILRMVSNRRQDYDGGLYELGQGFPDFLKAAPEQAISALSEALKSHNAREHKLEREPPMAFSILGREAQLRADYSHIWHELSGHPDEEIKLLDYLIDYLVTVSKEETGSSRLNRLLAAVIDANQLAVVWRALLNAGARNPETIGRELRELAWSIPILTCDDTTVPAGEMIRAIAGQLDAADRERVERAILSIPDLSSQEQPRSAEATRDRLLSCLPEDGLVTEEARRHVEMLHRTGAETKNEERLFFGASNRTWGEAEHLAEAGVPVDEEPNRRIRELGLPVKEFATAFLNNTPDETAVTEIMPHMRALLEALQSAPTDGVHVQQANYAWGHLAEACSAVAKMKNLSCADATGQFVREILLQASRHEIPSPDQDLDAKFDRPHWSKPAARIDGAAGIITLAFNSSCADREVLDAIERLSTDPVPSVRYQLAVRLRTLYRHSHEVCWMLIQRMASADPSRGVLRGLLEGTLRPLEFANSARVASLVIGILERTATWPDADELRNDCVTVLVDLFIGGKDERATKIVLDLADNPVGHLEQAKQVAGMFREILTDGPPDGSKPDAEQARGRAIDLLTRLTREAAAAFGRAVALATEAGDRDEKTTETLAHLLDTVGFNLYFVSGAHADDETARPDDKVQSRLLREAGQIIDTLADVGLPSLTHHLLETLEVLIPLDPQGVFMRVGAAVRGGTKGGYQYDRMAEDALVRIVEEYLAEHREIFQEDEAARRALIEILDTFVRAGSIGARRLSYGLDAIFR